MSHIKQIQEIRDRARKAKKTGGSSGQQWWSQARSEA
jgi:hypothetical protein